MPIPVLFAAGWLFEGIARIRFPQRVLPDPFYVIPIWLNGLLTLPILGIFWFFLSKLPYTVKGYYANDQAAADEFINVRLAPVTEWWPLATAILLYVTAVVVVGSCLRSRWLPWRVSAAGRELRGILNGRSTIARVGDDEWVWKEDYQRPIGSKPPPAWSRPPKPPQGPGGRWVRRR